MCLKCLKSLKNKKKIVFLSHFVSPTVPQNNIRYTGVITEVVVGVLQPYFNFVNYAFHGISGLSKNLRHGLKFSTTQKCLNQGSKMSKKMSKISGPTPIAIN